MHIDTIHYHIMTRNDQSIIVIVCLGNLIVQKRIISIVDIVFKVLIFRLEATTEKGKITTSSKFCKVNVNPCVIVRVELSTRTISPRKDWKSFVTDFDLNSCSIIDG